MKRLLPLLLLLHAAVRADAPADLASGRYGGIISGKALVKVSSTCQHDTPETHLNLVRGEPVPCAFHTREEKEPWVVLKLDREAEVKALDIVNRRDGSGFRAAGLVAWVSRDGRDWEQVWEAGGKAEARWVVPLVDGAGKGRRASWVKLGLRSEKPQFLHLSRVTIHGQ